VYCVKNPRASPPSSASNEPSKKPTLSRLHGVISQKIKLLVPRHFFVMVKYFVDHNLFQLSCISFFSRTLELCCGDNNEYSYKMNCLKEWRHLTCPLFVSIFIRVFTLSSFSTLILGLSNSICILEQRFSNFFNSRHTEKCAKMFNAHHQFFNWFLA
jgi:hypothetical protein